MINCTRFENEGLIALEQGLSLDIHFSTCEVCIEEQRKYTELKSMLHSTLKPDSLTLDWQQNVLDQIRAQPATSKVSNRKRWFGSLAAGMAAIGVLSILLLQAPDNERSKILQQQLVTSDKLYRGDDANVGDELRITSPQSTFKFTQIRVYRNGRPFFSCGSEQTCEIDKQSNTVKASIKLSAVGEYQTVLIRSNQKLNVSNKNLDLDVLTARKFEAQVMLAKPVSVD